MTPTISVIVAVDRDNAIGRNGELVYRLRDDMRHFRAVTMGHPVVMGRKTWQSLPAGALPGRRNVVVSRNPDFKADGAEVYPSLPAALKALENADTVMIIGGASIYAEALPLAHTLYLTQIDASTADADTYFPAVDVDQWAVIDRGEWLTDAETGLRYRFVCLSRK